MEPSNKKKGKQSSKTSQSKSKLSKNTSSQFWKVYSFFRSNLIVTSLLVTLIGALVLKYYEDVHGSYSNFEKVNLDIYNVLGVTKESTDSEIRSKYRELSMKWHPDKNKDCPECEARFMEIKEAYKIILTPYLREMYDKTKGHTVEMIRSKTFTLTSANYNKLVKDSKNAWVVQVYSDDNHRCKSFAPLWDEFSTKYEKYAKFGRVNTLLEKKLLKKMPVKVKILPSVFLFFPERNFDLIPTTSIENLKDLSSYFYKSYPFYGTIVESYEKFKSYPGRKLLFYCDRKNVPLNLKFLSLKFHKVVGVYYLSDGQHYSKNEELLKDMKSAENLPKVPEKLELFNLLVAFYQDGNLRHLSYQLSSNFQPLKQALYSMLSVDSTLPISMEAYDALCSRNSARDRLCVILPEQFHFPDVVSVMSKYETHSMVLSDEESEEKGVPEVDIQLLGRVQSSSHNLEPFFHDFSSKGKESDVPFKSNMPSHQQVVVLNKNRAKYTVFDQDLMNAQMLHDLLNGKANVSWFDYPNNLTSGWFKH